MKKSLYGLKQAPRQWYRKFDSFMTDQGNHKTQADHCVFVKKFNHCVITYPWGAVSWQSRLQKTVALSTTEAKYMVAMEAGNEIMWMKDFIGELDTRQEEYRLYCDNQSAIHLAKNAA